MTSKQIKNAAAALAVIALPMCVAAASAATRVPVVIDRWTSIKITQATCSWVPKQCDPRLVKGDYSLFEADVKAQLAARPECAGITVQVYNGSNNDVVFKPHWHLVFSYTDVVDAFGRRLLKQEWHMNLPQEGPSKPLGQEPRTVSGRGTPGQIATEVCNIVNGHGAVIEK